jgi:hypothetical protein
VLLPGHHVAPQLAQAKAQHQSSMNAALQKQADEMKRAAAVDGQPRGICSTSSVRPATD